MARTVTPGPLPGGKPGPTEWTNFSVGPDGAHFTRTDRKADRVYLYDAATGDFVEEFPWPVCSRREGLVGGGPRYLAGVTAMAALGKDKLPCRTFLFDWKQKKALAAFTRADDLMVYQTFEAISANGKVLVSLANLGEVRVFDLP